jgi:hypothetical protein
LNLLKGHLLKSQGLLHSWKYTWAPRPPCIDPVLLYYCAYIAIITIFHNLTTKCLIFFVLIYFGIKENNSFFPFSFSVLTPILPFSCGIHVLLSCLE